jgi:hypothetical protein
MRKRIVSILVCLIVSVPAFAMDWAGILAQVRMLEKDNVSTAYRWTDQELLDRANMIQDDMCAKTFLLQKRYYISTSSGTQEYRLPSDCIKILRAGYMINGSTDAYKKLTFVTIAGKDSADSNWQNKADGLPLEYYRRSDYVGLIPAPSASYYGTDYLQVDYVVRASSMSATTDIPFNGDYTLYPFHQAIIYGICALCEWEKGNSAGYTTMQTVYLDWLMKIYTIVGTEPEKGMLNFTK